MAYSIGSNVRVNKIQMKDFDWIDNEFEVLSGLVNGKSGTIIEHFPEAPEYGERESYLIEVHTDSGIRKLELESDEFELI